MKLKDSGHAYEIGERASPHLAHYPLAMRLDCTFGRSQFGAGLLVQETGSDQTEDLAFARRETGVAFFEFDPLDMLGTPLAREIGAACYRTQ